MTGVVRIQGRGPIKASVSSSLYLKLFHGYSVISTLYYPRAGSWKFHHEFLSVRGSAGAGGWVETALRYDPPFSIFEVREYGL